MSAPVATVDREEPGPLVEVGELAGRGRGLVAVRSLKRGTRIYDEAPLIALPTDLFSAPDGLAQAGALIGAALKALSKTEQASFLCLSNCFVGAGRPALPALLGTFCTNAIEAAGNSAVFPQIARANHSCSPNAVYSWHEPTQTQRLHLLTDLDPGDEVLVSYIDPRQPRADRRAVLSAQYGFDCTCSMCADEGSDERWATFAKLRTDLAGWPARRITGRRALELSQQMVDVCDQQGYPSQCVEQPLRPI